MRHAIGHGISLDEEPGLGALTIPGYLREVCTCFVPREALAWQEPGGVARWSYEMLWERSSAVARALLCCVQARPCACPT